MKETQWKCAMCGHTFDKGWSDEKAKAEYERNFGDIEPDEENVVCDECYQEVLKYYQLNNLS